MPIITLPLMSNTFCALAPIFVSFAPMYNSGNLVTHIWSYLKRILRVSKTSTSRRSWGTKSKILITAHMGNKSLLESVNCEEFPLTDLVLVFSFSKLYASLVVRTSVVTRSSELYMVLFVFPRGFGSVPPQPELNAVLRTRANHEPLRQLAAGKGAYVPWPLLWSGLVGDPGSHCWHRQQGLNSFKAIKCNTSFMRVWEIFKIPWLNNVWLAKT